MGHIKFKPLNWILLIALVFVFAEFNLWADDSPPRSETPPVSSAQPRKKSKGKRPREKEAEGTQAPNRFDADIIIKSKYELNGQSLEVDTD